MIGGVGCTSNSSEQLLGIIVSALLATSLAGCSTFSGRDSPKSSVARTTTTSHSDSSSQQSAASARGAFYKDDGPGDNPPSDPTTLPEPVPRIETLHRFANNPYSVFGQDYVPLRNPGNFIQEGMGSWYGRKFHGQKTSSGEPYDMYGISAAHPVLPIPSYARVTHLDNGRSVVVRINDRGPFHPGRVIDLSWSAAAKLGYTQQGSARLRVETITPEQIDNWSVARSKSEQTLFTIRSSDERNAAPNNVPSIATQSGELFLQLGSFSAPENAESFRGRVAMELGELVPDGGLRLQTATGTSNNQRLLYRVQLGPYASRSEAEQVADRVRQVLGLKPVLLQR
jgi:rare lipoprotein A